MGRTVVAVPEQTVRLRVNGRSMGTWTCSPGALESLAAGRLLTAGFIRGADDILALNPFEDGATHGIDARLTEEAAQKGFAEQEHRREHGCGLRFLLDCEPPRITGRSRPVPPQPGDFGELFRALYERAESYRTTGGMHTAALSDGAGLQYHQEEVGRHNAADRVIGQAVLDGADLRRLGLVTTARISGEIAEKAARAGLAWIASRSVPTTLAAEIAAAAGIPIIARAPSPDARTFAPEAE